MQQADAMMTHRRLGLQWVSAVDDLMSVRKALAAGLFANAAQYMSTTVESKDKEHTGVDLYHLVRSTGHGQPSSSFLPLAHTWFLHSLLHWFVLQTCLMLLSSQQLWWRPASMTFVADFSSRSLNHACIALGSKFATEANPLFSLSCNE